MPVLSSYPGVYINEINAQRRSITGVATYITAFIGRALRGPENKPIEVLSYADYERRFGGLSRMSTLSYAVQQYFQNGGKKAVIVRVQKGGQPATLSLPKAFTLVANSRGTWGNHLRIRIDYDTYDPADSTLFTLTIHDPAVGITEHFPNLSMVSNNNRFIKAILAEHSTLVYLEGEVAAIRPSSHAQVAADRDPWAEETTSTGFNSNGDDGQDITDDNISLASLESESKGIWALDKAEMFNLLCIPPLTHAVNGDVNARTRRVAASYCEQRRAIYLADPLSTWTAASHVIGDRGLDSAEWGLSRNPNVALYFPRIEQADPLQNNRMAEFAPCGAVAGVIARIDMERGVWKAPAGQTATLRKGIAPTIRLTDHDNDRLNPLAVNCLRSFPNMGAVIWGARTLMGADQLVSEWKYLPVRRLALFIAESVWRGTQWVVFEPNAEPLWSRIRLDVEAFLQELFRQGAFQGSTSHEAYFVKCDKETNTQYDIEHGVVNIVVGFAALQPGEFTVMTIQQSAS